MRFKYIFVVLIPVALLIWLITRITFVMVVSPRFEKVVDVVYANGFVEPDNQILVSSQTTGILTEIKISEGQIVKVGDELFCIDDFVARQEYNRTFADLQFWEAKNRALSSLHTKQLTSYTEAANTKLAYDKAVAAHEISKKQLSNACIASPIAGEVLVVIKKANEFAQSGEVIAKIGNVVDKRVVAYIDENDILSISLGQKALILPEASESDLITASVDKILPEGNKDDQKFQIYIKLPKESKLLSGMNVRVNIVRREQDRAMVLPNESIFSDSVQVYSNNKVILRKITVGASNKEVTEIISNLSATDKVVKPFNPKLNYHSFVYAKE